MLLGCWRTGDRAEEDSQRVVVCVHRRQDLDAVQRDKIVLTNLLVLSRLRLMVPYPLKVAHTGELEKHFRSDWTNDVSLLLRIVVPGRRVDKRRDDVNGRGREKIALDSGADRSFKIGNVGG